ncbi:hypothetical protein E2C01_038211 [Portunus trituberculatus]|uniref:Uncharacterized protein n=1 Tax=Portunus trituberculatus TaxID=210409 RepID=A0A5B7FG89_PORTR|nr:hypothetical protein [Portunus trituberculatus]
MVVRVTVQVVGGADGDCGWVTCRDLFSSPFTQYCGLMYSFSPRPSRPLLPLPLLPSHLCVRQPVPPHTPNQRCIV